MMAIPFVDKYGYFIEDKIVDEGISGVISRAEDRGEEYMTLGFLVGYEIKQGLYKPRLDLIQLEKDFGRYSWDTWPKTLTTEQIDKYWVEGLTQEEIDALNKPAPPTEVEQLRQEMREGQAEMWDFILGGTV